MGAPPDRRTRRIVRLLGGRQVIQAVATGADPTATVLAVGTAVDVLHGLTMVVLATVDPHRRRVALGDALIATAFVSAGVVLAAGAPHRRPRQPDPRDRGGLSAPTPSDYGPPTAPPVGRRQVK